MNVILVCNTIFTDSLATKKFDFDEEKLSCKIKFTDNIVSLNPTPLLIPSNFPVVCAMIHAEYVPEKLQKIEKKQIEGKKSTRSRNQVVRPSERKLEYVDDNEDEEDTVPEPAVQKSVTVRAKKARSSKLEL